MRPAGLALLRSAVSNEWTAKLLREFLVSRVLRKVVGSLGYDPDVRAARAALVASLFAALADTASARAFMRRSDILILEHYR